MKHIKKLVKLGVLVSIIIALSIFSIDWFIKESAIDRTYNTTKEIPYNKVGLLLGTPKFLLNGQVNLYYKYRIEAAEQLFKSGRIEFIIVSGTTARPNNNEPVQMRNSLINIGIPSNKIFLDSAGFRTLDSVVRANKIFGQESITIISQQFHNERAVFIAEYKDMKAVGYNAKDVTFRYGLKTQLREKLARVKMVLDLTFGIKPKLLGEQIEIR